MENIDPYPIKTAIITPPFRKKCESCKTIRQIDEFIGVKGYPTYKCLKCNLRASRYVKKHYVPTGGARGRPSAKSLLDS